MQEPEVGNEETFLNCPRAQANAAAGTWHMKCSLQVAKAASMLASQLMGSVPGNRWENPSWEFASFLSWKIPTCPANELTDFKFLFWEPTCAVIHRCYLISVGTGPWPWLNCTEKLLYSGEDRRA